MKTKTKLLNLIIALSLFSNCLKEDCDNSTENKYVDKNYLPYIIPYTDTSTRLFLKNGKDTLLFKSQGLKETIEVQIGNDIGNCKTYKLQQYSLKMAASDTDFFEVKYFAIINGIPSFSYNSNYRKMNEVDYDFLAWRSIRVLDNNYDSVAFNHNKYGDSVYSKTKIGAIRIKSLNNVYELIK
jgi:hypothetical protein